MVQQNPGIEISPTVNGNVVKMSDHLAEGFIGRILPKRMPQEHLAKSSRRLSAAPRGD